tara:strand:- start:2836 stop:3012 length:177 start_codon:yes stop_codon:yes gene_type:complete
MTNYTIVFEIGEVVIAQSFESKAEHDKTFNSITFKDNSKKGVQLESFTIGTDTTIRIN